MRGAAAPVVAAQPCGRSGSYGWRQIHSKDGRPGAVWSRAAPGQPWSPGPGGPWACRCVAPGAGLSCAAGRRRHGGLAPPAGPCLREWSVQRSAGSRDLPMLIGGQGGGSWAAARVASRKSCKARSDPLRTCSPQGCILRCTLHAEQSWKWVEGCGGPCSRRGAKMNKQWSRGPQAAVRQPN